MIQVPYTPQLFEEDGQIVALCPELNVSSFGDTTKEALASLQEAVTLFLEECQRMGTLETVLEQTHSTIDSPLLALANLGESPETDVSERAKEILASEIGATTGWSVPHADPR